MLFVSVILQSFSVLDDNGDGRISKSEITRAYRLAGFNPTTTELEDILKEHDLNGMYQYLDALNYNLPSHNYVQTIVRRIYMAKPVRCIGHIAWLRAKLQINCLIKYIPCLRLSSFLSYFVFFRLSSSFVFYWLLLSSIVFFVFYHLRSSFSIGFCLPLSSLSIVFLLLLSFIFVFFRSPSVDVFGFLSSSIISFVVFVLFFEFVFFFIFVFYTFCISFVFFFFLFYRIVFDRISIFQFLSENSRT